MELYELGIKDAQAGLAKGEFSSADIVRSIIGRMHDVNDKVGAYLTFDEEAALALAEANPKAVPIAIKDLINVSGQPCTCGSKILKGYVSPYDATVVKNLKANGTEYDSYFAAVEGGAKAKDIADAKKAAEDVIEGMLDPTLDPECYKMTTFKPYADEAPIVTFSNGSDVDVTDAICAVLTAVDPACTNKTENEYFENNAISTGAIFNGNKTDFYNAMKAEYDYYVAANPNIKDELAAIEAWIKSVEAAFENDATDAGKEDTTMEYYYQVFKALYAADTAFYGIAEDSRYDVPKVGGKYVPFDMPNNVMYGAGIAGSYDDPDSITPDKYIPELLHLNVLGDCDGWNEALGGELLTLAEELFPDFPETWQGWKEAIFEYNDEKAHQEILMDSFKAAYYAAAKAAGYDQFNKDGKAAGDWDALYKAYKTAREAYVQTLKNNIEANTKIIDDNSRNIAEYWSEVPVIDIEIADAAANLQIEEHRLAALEQALTYAKANLEKILEYVQSQDFSYVLLNADASNLGFDTTALQTALDVLKNLGISIPGII